MPTIMVVEDDDDSAEMLQYFFTTNGFKSTRASTIAGGITLYAQHRPDLILLDLHLTDGYGTDLARRLHNAPPIIIASACADLEMEYAAASIKAVAIMQKPFELDELLTRVRDNTMMVN